MLYSLQDNDYPICIVDVQNHRQDMEDTESWHELITMDREMAKDPRNLVLSYTEDGFNVT